MTWQVAMLMLPGLVVGLTVHEFAHAWSASLLGDGYARRQGRVSLNPLRHLSPLGTLVIFLLPFGWGRPVPVNLYNFKRPRRDYLLTSLAGPAANVLMVLLCMGLMLLTLHPYRFQPPYDQWMEWSYRMLELVVVINVLLAAFNLVPIPPLDGSKIWPCVIPGLKPGMRGKSAWISLIVLLGLVWSGSLNPLVHFAVGGVQRLLPVSDVRLFQGHWLAADQAMEKELWPVAEQQYGKALDVNPRADGCLAGRAAARINQAKWSEALEDVNRALELRPDPTYYRIRAAVFLALGRPTEAKADEAAADAMDPPAAQAGSG